MDPKWHFNDRRKKDPIRDPIQGEFFANEAIKNPEEALIREGIQNSLDAAVSSKTGSTVRVRILLATGTLAAPAKAVKKYMSGGWEHFRAPKNGIKHPPADSDNCSYLVFEDFETCGLNGDVTQFEEEEGNLFFYFFRAEGRSEKLADKRGRWGVGKHVFPSASRINSFLGLTVRSEDGGRCLMGRSILKCHSVDGKAYMPDGYFGLADGDDFVGPTNDGAYIDEFCDTFHISRHSEPGLSIVIPWLNADFEIKALISAVLRGYFFPILEGKLVVTVESTDGPITIDDQSITNLTDKYLNGEAEELRPMLRLGAWAAFAKENEFVKLNPTDPSRPVWSKEMLPADRAEELKDRFQRGERIALRAPLTVRSKEKGAQPALSHIDIFLIRDGYESGKPLFIREGIMISGVKAPLVRGVRSLVLASDGAIASLLGDAENPSHTEWLSGSAHFGEKYFHGKAYLDFVTQSVHKFVQLLTEADRAGDPTLLLDIFALPTDDENGVPRTGNRKKADKGGPDDRPPPPPPKPKMFRVERVKGGFSIIKGDCAPELPLTLHVRAAYDVRRGNPLKKYEVADFVFVRAPVRVETLVGAKIRDDGPNSLLVDITSTDFHVTINGFDTKRDLFLKVVERSAPDDTKD